MTHMQMSGQQMTPEMEEPLKKMVESETNKVTHPHPGPRPRPRPNHNMLLTPPHLTSRHLWSFPSSVSTP